MKRFLIVILTISSASTFANDTLIETIEKFTDIFAISFSQNNGSTVATLDANYYVTDELRVFGDIDTDLVWEVGAGYSIWSGETYYTENSLKVSERRVSTGIFGAKLLNEKWTAIGDVNYNFQFDSESCWNNTDLCWIQDKADTIEFSVGGIWSPIEHLDWIYKYNKEFSYKNNQFELKNSNLPKIGSKTNYDYHEFITVINLSYFKPSVTYTHSDFFENSIEFGVSFDF
jgi:hypothetical protein